MGESFWKCEEEVCVCVCVCNVWERVGGIVKRMCMCVCVCVCGRGGELVEM